MTLQHHAGRTETRTDTVWPPLVRGMAATLGIAEPARVLPPLWHWMLFQDWAPADGLGPDGHPRRGGFLPPLDDLPRRMWAGGRLVFHAPLVIGEPVSRTSTIVSVTEKQGASGRLVFVTVCHEITGTGGPAITEEQDLVYRGAESAAVRPVAPVAPVAAVAARIVRPDAVLLFRYSALTGNGHRIHYDTDYARDVEHYPGAVVHGPLQATWLAALAGEGLRHFSFRAQRPAFAGNPLVLEAWPEDGVLRLRSRDEKGAVCMTAEAGS